MDNLSHSIAGLGVGELIQRGLPPEPDAARHGVRRRLLLVSCWAASNFPDLDVVLTPLLPAPLGYLLHHRGHTHTLLYLIPQALGLLALIWCLWPSARRLLRESTSARVGLLAAVVPGFVLHLSMDYLNSYGVHPFHPFDSRWWYGDMVFIIEPLFWVAFGVPLAMMVRRRLLRFAYVALLAGVPLLLASRGYLLWSSSIALLAIGAGLGALQQRAGHNGSHGLLGALAVLAAFIGGQALAFGQARQLVAAELRARDPASRLLDVSLTAYPSNSLCWAFVSVERNDAADSYRLRRGTLSVAPVLTPVESCPARFAQVEHSASSPALQFSWEYEGSLAFLRRLKQTDCRVAAWLRFARAPVIGDTEANDARFGTGFAILPFARLAGQPCPEHVPQWGFPRLDLLMP